MNNTLPSTATARADTAASTVEIPQLRIRGIFAVWAAAAVPMAALLFTAYHLHVPWAMPATLLDTFTLAYPTKRYRSAWIGIAVHSSQSVFFALLIRTLVL